MRPPSSLGHILFYRPVGTVTGLIRSVTFILSRCQNRHTSHHFNTHFQKESVTGFKWQKYRFYGGFHPHVPYRYIYSRYDICLERLLPVLNLTCLSTKNIAVLMVIVADFTGKVNGWFFYVSGNSIFCALSSICFSSIPRLLNSSMNSIIRLNISVSNVPRCLYFILDLSK